MAFQPKQSQRQLTIMFKSWQPYISRVCREGIYMTWMHSNIFVNKPVRKVSLIAVVISVLFCRLWWREFCGNNTHSCHCYSCGAYIIVDPPLWRLKRTFLNVWQIVVEEDCRKLFELSNNSKPPGTPLFKAIYSIAFQTIQLLLWRKMIPHARFGQ